MEIKLNETICLDVATTFGTIPVTFTIIAILPNYHYALVAQDRIVVGQQKSNGTWVLSDSVDLHSIKPIEGVYHYVALD